MSRIARVLVSLCFALSVLSISRAFPPSGVAAAGGWTTSGTQILTPAGTPYLITGINWYGFETKSYVAHGMCCQDYTYILNEVKQDGYNTIRIPFSNQMWESDPTPGSNTISACSACKGKHSRDILALIINYAGSIGLHVILDNHRSEAGNSAEGNGLWYTSSYSEQSWINDWVNMQRWVHGQQMTQGSTDTVTVNDTASDGYPTVIGYDLRNEPHTPSRTAYTAGATWGTGDGISPASNPNPNPFAPACASSSTCVDWRLAAERAGDSILGDASSHGWSYPLIFVEGISQYPTASGTAGGGPYDYYWWGGQLQGVNGNAGNPGAPVVFNAGGSASSLGPAVSNQLVYSAHDYGPAEYAQSWFNSSTCYTKGCSASSLSDLWVNHWAYLNLSGGINPVWPGHSSYPWSNTGATAYTQAPVWIGEFGTGNTSSAVDTSGAGSQGQWFTDLINFIQSSESPTSTNSSGYAVSNLNFTYWALNTEDSYALLGTSWTGLAYAPKEYSFLCFVQWGPLAVPHGTASNQCGNTGALPGPS
ncbi:MAG TPA: cellulase family glycosylhydrolase [Chloroflexota bacterium]|nr:cellulase family glycosylhydrolase [Chloroflexota bacterium]